jgi:DNA polymerase-4
VADLAHTPPSALHKLLGAAGDHVHRLAWGIDGRPVTTERAEKSIGAEETFGEDVADTAQLRRELLRLAHRTAARLRSSRLQCRTVSLKLRYADFTTINRSRTLREPADSAQQLYAAAVHLLEALGQRPQAVRLVGLRAEQLEPSDGAGRQLSLDGSEDQWRNAEQALDEVNRKFGGSGLVPAALLDVPARRRIPPGARP